MRGARSWQQGTTAPAPEPARPQEAEFDYDPTSRSAVMLSKATAFVRRRYGIPSGIDGIGRWTPRMEAQVRRVYHLLMSGEQIPAQWMDRRREPAPVDPTTWITPRQRL